MSDNKLPPQTSPTDTSNWDDKVFTTPVAKSVDDLKKQSEKREIMLNGPERKRTRRAPSPDIQPIKK